MTNATISMTILRGAPTWREVNHGYEMLQRGFRLLAARLFFDEACAVHDEVPERN
jgi:hypothetical protein